MEKVRINIMIPQPVNELLESHCKEYGLSKGGAVAMILQQFFQQQDVINRTKDLPNILGQLKQFAKDIEKIGDK